MGITAARKDTAQSRDEVFIVKDNQWAGNISLRGVILPNISRTQEARDGPVRLVMHLPEGSALVGRRGCHRRGNQDKDESCSP